MREYLYKKVNAFTTEGSNEKANRASIGNPAAYLYIGEETLSPEEMLGIGKEHAGFVSEVVFCMESKKADLKLVYYSSQCEVDFCGHGTIATMYDLIKDKKIGNGTSEVTIETNKKGILTVYNEMEAEDAVFITAPKAEHLEVTVTEKEIADALKVEEACISSELPVDFIDAGLKTLIVPICNLDTEISIFPDEAVLKDFCLNNGIDIILIFCMETKQAECIAHTRVFAPKFGYLEDPATGSGNSAFGNYMRKNNCWDGSCVSIEQGSNRFIYNTVKLKVKGGEILFGGKATIKIAGSYFI